MAITADNLLTGIKRRVSLPSSQALLEDDDFLAMADNVIRSKLVPLFESVDDDFFVTSTDVSLTASTSEYNIPYRAIGRALRDIKIKDSDGENVRNLSKIAIEDIHMFSSESLCSGFYFKGDRLYLVPDVGSSPTEKLEIWYRLPPNKLAVTSDVATVVSATTTVVTVDAVPSTFSTSTTLDFIQGKSGNRLYSIDVTPTATGATTLTFTSGDIPTALTAGDYVALSGYSPVVNYIPDDGYSYLETCLARRVLKTIGDYEGAKELQDDEADERRDLLKIISPRIDGEPTIIINRTGLVRGNKYGQRRWLYGQS
jgi:hypothetical protein